MSTNVPIEDWSSRFAHKLSELGSLSELVELVALGAERFPTLGHLEPEVAAQAEYENWPPRQA